jgi:serine/threonine protein phosphatase PrpC
MAAAGSGDPLVVARHLVAFANAAGGQDNITAALARVGDVTAGLATDPGVPSSTTGNDDVRNNAASQGGETDG